MSEASILKNYFHKLYKSLLAQHLNSTSLKPTEDEETQVKAFCVLAHAAVEEFIEKLSLSTLQRAYSKYKSKQIITKIPATTTELEIVNLGIVQLIETLILASNFSTFSSQSDTLKSYRSKLERVTEIYKSGSTASMQDLNELTKKTDSYTKEILKETRKFFDSHIENNHGASLKYLLRILVPVGIDIPNLIELNSLQKLEEYRGNYAHAKGLIQINSASDLVSYAKDVLKVCKAIEQSVDNFEKI